MVIIPHLTHNCVPVIQTSLSLRRSIVPRTRAAYIRQRAKALRQRGLQIRQTHIRAIRRPDPGRAQPVVGRQVGVILHRGREEIDNVAVVDVRRPVARQVEGREAGAVLAELVAPEVAVGLSLRDPVFVHVGEEVELAERREEGAYAGSCVWRDGSPGGIPGRGVWEGTGVVLSTDVLS